MKRWFSLVRVKNLSPVMRERVRQAMALIACLAMSYSCTMTNSRPEGILSKDEMAKVLTEFYLKEARINTFHLGQDSAAKLMQYYRHQYSQNTGTPDSIVEASYQYYLAHPREMSEIYDRIIDTLSLKEQRTPVGISTKPVE